jgi:hypothetical protein
MMSRFYDKGAEASIPDLRRSRFELEVKREKLKKVGIDNVASLDLARLERWARAMFEDQGLGGEIAPLSDWLVKVLGTCVTDDEGEPVAGYGPSVRRAAAMYALMRKVGVDVPDVSRATRYRWQRVLTEARVAVEDACLVEPEDDGDVIWLDVDERVERRRSRRSA